MSARPEPIRLDALLGAPDAGATAIRGLTADSRKVEPGYLFAALPGTRGDGRAHIDQAVARGAVALLVPRGSSGARGRGAALVEDRVPRRRLAEMAACFYDRQPAHMTAVTGTNGKTSVASFARQLWQLAGIEAASIGTLGVASRKLNRPGGLTSPDPVALHAVLAELAARGVSHAICEASSHGLAQYRLDGIRFAVAAFSNLSRDHLDYHRSFEAYFYAKARLFAELMTDDGTAVVMTDSEHGRQIAAIASGHGRKLLRIGRDTAADLRIVDLAPSPQGQRLTVELGGASRRVALKLVGAFQAENALLAAGTVIAGGLAATTVLPLLARLGPVPGRLERVGAGKAGAPVFVDYAHTPDGLATVLAALRPHVRGKLHLVFGCGGDRDRGKRPEMGAIAARLADLVIVTDDNPRSENAAAIRREILVACPDAAEIGDRGEAIATAIAGLAEGDLLLIAGKGHEDGQIVGDRVLPFNDAECARAVLREEAS